MYFFLCATSTRSNLWLRILGLVGRCGRRKRTRNCDRQQQATSWPRRICFRLLLTGKWCRDHWLDCKMPDLPHNAHPQSGASLRNGARQSPRIVLFSTKEPDRFTEIKCSRITRVTGNSRNRSNDGFVDFKASLCDLIWRKWKTVGSPAMCYRLRNKWRPWQTPKASLLSRSLLCRSGRFTARYLASQ